MTADGGAPPVAAGGGAVPLEPADSLLEAVPPEESSTQPQGSVGWAPEGHTDSPTVASTL